MVVEVSRRGTDKTKLERVRTASNRIKEGDSNRGGPPAFVLLQRTGSAHTNKGSTQAYQ